MQVRLSLTFYHFIKEMNLIYTFLCDIFICHLSPLFRYSSLHFIAADILVLCIVSFCSCIYSKCINHLISVNCGNDGYRRNIETEVTLLTHFSALSNICTLNWQFIILSRKDCAQRFGL